MVASESGPLFRPPSRARSVRFLYVMTSSIRIHLQPGELRIEFYGAEDLLRHLFELSQAMVNDFARFQSAIESAMDDVPASRPGRCFGLDPRRARTS